MATTRELIRELHDARNRLREEQKALFEQMEGAIDGEGNAERQSKFDALDKDIVTYGERIRSLTTMLENEKQASEDREKFETLLRSDGETFADGKDLETKVRTWMRAGLPDSEVWAPRSITIDLHGITMSRLALERHDLVKGTTTAGGYTVPTGFVRQLAEHLVEESGVRQTNAQVLTTGSGEDMPYPKTTSHGSAVLVGEGVALTENDPAFGQITLNAYKFGQLEQVSRELIEDTAIDLLGYLARAAGRALGVVTNTYFTTGTGTAQPQGVANSPTAGKTGATGQTGTVIANDLVDLYHSITSGYRSRAYWLLNDASAAIIRKIRDDTGGTGLGNFLWQPGLQAGAPDTIFGRPVVTSADMATMAANAYSIAFGDFSSYYVIRDVGSVRFERSDDYAFANDLVSFRSILRTDGKQLINGSAAAVKFYRNSAT